MKTELTARSDDGYPSGYPKVFWFALFAGWVVIGVGLRGLLVNSDSPMATDPPGWVSLMVKSNLGHDFVLVPLVLGVGTVVARWVPACVRSAVQFGLILTGTVLLYAFPFFRGYGRAPGNPSILPQDYARGTFVVLGFVWAVTAVIAAWSLWRSRRPSRPTTGGTPGP